MEKQSFNTEDEERYQSLALRYHNEIFQEGKLEVADEILSPDFVIHNPVLPEELRKGPEGAKKVCICNNGSCTRFENLYMMMLLQKGIR